MKSRFVGVDCGEDQVVLVWLDARGGLAGSRQVRNQRNAIRRVLLEIQEKLEAGEQLEVVLESLYAFSSPTAEVARDLGLGIRQAQATRLEYYRNLEGQPRKDDERDAYLLARMARFGMKGCRIALAPTPEEQVLRRLSRLHRCITQQRQQSKLRLRSRLLELAPVLVSSKWKGPKWSSASMLAVLDRWPALIGLETARISSIRRVLKAAANVSSDKIESQAKALKELARSLSQSITREILGLDIAHLVKDIRNQNESLKEVDAKIEERVQAHAVARKLLDMPGVGAFTAAAVTGELGPLARTSTEAKVATYAGLTPIARTSGKLGRKRLARGVNKHAQQACYMSAIASLRRSALDHAYYRKQRASHRGHPKEHVVATLALARQRIKVMYKLLTTDAVYDREILIARHLERERRAA